MEEIPAGLSESVDQVLELGNQIGPLLSRSLLLLLVILMVAKYAGRLLGRLLLRMGVSERRAMFPVTALHIGALMLVALVVLNAMGVPALNLVRFLVIIGMAILAIVIVFGPYLPRLPFKEGDVVSQGSLFGPVEKIAFAHTTIRTVDGKMAFVPNHKMLSEPLTNLSVHPFRRADVGFFVPYDEDLDTVLRVVSETLEEDERVLEEPPPVVVVTKLAPSYREMLARFWVDADGFLGAQWAICEKIDRTLFRHGIRRGVPQIEVVSGGNEPAQPARS